MTYWFTARICSSLLAMSIPVGSAWSQGGDQANVTPQMPLSQAVTFADLEGAKIHAKLVTEMLAERQGRRGPATQEIDWQIFWSPMGGSILASAPRPSRHAGPGGASTGFNT